jgi:5'-3' exonuclease
VKVHLIDGTYELFRQHFGMVMRHGEPGPNDAAIGVVNSTLQLVQKGATHVGVASDHVIESFRNDLYDGYKTGEGMDPVLLAQIPVMEDVLVAAGFTTWPMVQWEADDALGAAAAVAEADPRVEQVLIVTPDKDLGQCVRGVRVVQYDRRKDEIVDEDAVVAKFGVPPSSIADYLALVGDSADGYPGLPGWGAKGSATVLSRWGTIEAIPASAADWDLPGLRGAEKLARTLQEQMADALLFKRIATVALDVPVGAVDEWRWQGPTAGFRALVEGLGAAQLADRAEKLAKKIAPAG